MPPAKAPAKKQPSAKEINTRDRASEAAAEAMASGLHDHDNPESFSKTRMSEGSSPGKHARFAEPPPKDLSA